MRISDWSSDVCSSDLLGSPGGSAFASSIVANNGNTFLGIFIEHGNNANRRITAIASSLEEVRRQVFNPGEGAADDDTDKPDDRCAHIATSVVAIIALPPSCLSSWLAQAIWAVPSSGRRMCFGEHPARM